MIGDPISRRQALALLGAGAGVALSGRALAEAGFYHDAPMLKAAVAAGIPVIGYDRPISLDGVLSIGFNQADVGRLQSLAVARTVPTTGAPPR